VKYEIQDGLCRELVAYVINLKRRPERLASFWDNWRAAKAGEVLPRPHVWQAFDGVEHAKEMPTDFLPKETCNRPAGWGCVSTHANILRCMAGLSSPGDPMGCDVAIFEDDAHFVPDFVEKASTYLTSLPDDFDFAYLGGFHVAAPKQIGISLGIPVEMHGTHGYIVRRNFLVRVASALSKCDNHPDLIIGKLLRESKAKAFCPIPSLVGQGGFVSEIVGKLQPKVF